MTAKTVKQRHYFREAPELGKYITCTVYGQTADGYKVYESPEEPDRTFFLCGGKFYILNER